MQLKKRIYQVANQDDKASREFKIKRYHSDEVKMVLFISATDLKSYHVDNLKIFAECIEGRIEALLTPEYLVSIKNFLDVDIDSIDMLLDLKNRLQQKYSGEWYRKMLTSSWKNDVYDLANEILKLLQIDYQEPLAFMENHFEVDWD